MEKTIIIMTPQFERQHELGYDYKPTNDEEFYNTILNAPIKVLKDIGFGVWDTMNRLIQENTGRKPFEKITIPVFNAADLADVLSGEVVKTEHVIEFDGAPTDCPKEYLEQDETVLLFPHEWYDIIPDGFMVTGLYGETYPFKRGKTDDDMRFGCLPYGIRKLSNPL